MGLQLKEATTFELSIKIDCPVASGSFTADAKVRTKPEFKALLDRVQADELTDEQVVRELVTGFKGLPCEAGKEFEFVLTGPASAYLIPAVIQAYFEQFGEARTGNSKRSRGR
jgi:hypothetical protein